MLWCFMSLMTKAQSLSGFTFSGNATHIEHQQLFLCMTVLLPRTYDKVDCPSPHVLGYVMYVLSEV